MPYNPQLDAPVLISKRHKEMLLKLKELQGRRSMRMTLELLIEKALSEHK